MNTASLTPDLRETPCSPNYNCNCPGGYFVTIDGVTSSNGEPFRAIKIPSDFNYNQPFPISVKINWNYDPLICKDIIDITQIANR